MLIMGFGNLAHKQITKGLLFLLGEVIYIAFMAISGVAALAMLPSLGETQQQEVWNEAKGIYEYVQGDNSLLILLFGIATVFITIFFIVFWRGAVKSAYKAQYLKEQGIRLNTFKDDVKDLFNKNLHKTLMSLPFAGILYFPYYRWYL